MANTLRIKRRWSGGAGGPASLKSGELAYSGVDGILYIGFGDDGAGNATSVAAIASDGSYVKLTGDQTVAGIKTFSSSPLVPTAAPGTSNTQAASTAFVANAVTAGSVADGDKGDITVSSSGTVWTIDADSVTNAKLADMATMTLKGNNTGGSANPIDLTASQAKTLLALVKADVGLSNVDNTSDANKPVSTATQTALDLKANIASPTFTGTPAAPTATAGTSTTQLATTAFVTTADNLKANLASPTFTGTPAAPTASAGTNTTQIATTAYVITEIAARLASNDAMLYKGAIDASTNPNYPAANSGDTYRISVAGKIGGASGPNVQAGDMIICHLDGSATGTHASVGANWDILQTNIDGALVTTDIGVTVQGYDATLAGIAATAPTANQGLYASGSDTFSTYSLTAGGRALGGVAGTANTLPYFSASNVVTLASLTAAGLALLDDADATAQRTTLGLGTMATQNASAVAITGGTIDGVTIDGGTY